MSRPDVLEGGTQLPFTRAAIAFLDAVADISDQPQNLTPDVAAQSLRNAIANRYGIQRAVDALCVGLALCVADQPPGNDPELLALISKRIASITIQMRGPLS